MLEVDLDMPTCKMGRYLAQRSNFSLAISNQGLTEYTEVVNLVELPQAVCNISR